MRRGPWIQTFSGRKFHPLDPRPDDVDICDVAHALSMVCRFNGHCRDFYSVAQHSVHVAELSIELHPKAGAWGLLHDASEAYVGDVTRPVKSLLETYRDIEDRIARAVIARFDVCETPAVRAAVHLADDRLLATEARDLMAPPPETWQLAADPLPSALCAWPSQLAERRFLDAFERLVRVAT